MAKSMRWHTERHTVRSMATLEATVCSRRPTTPAVDWSNDTLSISTEHRGGNRGRYIGESKADLRRYQAHTVGLPCRLFERGGEKDEQARERDVVVEIDGSPRNRTEMKPVKTRITKRRG